MKIVAAVYSHPEYYPPTLNALNALANECDSVYCVHRNVKSTDLAYATNIKLINSGKFKTIRDTEQASFFWKLFSFVQFAYTLFQTIRKQKPKWVLLYDPFPFLAYHLIKVCLANKPKVWYHNHDILAMNKVGKFSLGRLACYNEKKNLAKIDLFSLPAEERKKYFNLADFKGKYIFLPNYPTRARAAFCKVKPNINPLKLMYQGQIGSGNGLEKIVDFIGQSQLNVKLDIIGVAVDISFKNKLQQKIDKLALTDRVVIHLPLPSYEDLLKFSATHHIGIATYEPVNTQYKTVTTASNKIYEYIALGMPVILFEDDIFRNKLGKLVWAKFTDLSPQSLEIVLTDIIENYQIYTQAAQNDFINKLNFEHNFAKIRPVINQ